jgi:hypothetical protein
MHKDVPAVWSQCDGLDEEVQPLKIIAANRMLGLVGSESERAQ